MCIFSNLLIYSIIFDCLATEESEILRDYELKPFKMKTQALSRTIIDKNFLLYVIIIW